MLEQLELHFEFTDGLIQAEIYLLKLNHLAQQLPSNQLMDQGIANLFYSKMLNLEIQMWSIFKESYQKSLKSFLWIFHCTGAYLVTTP